MNRKKEVRYVIWSHEHRQWWRPSHSGYTEELGEAGRYTFEEAARITIGVLPPGVEIAVEEDVAKSWGREGIHGYNESRERRASIRHMIEERLSILRGWKDDPFGGAETLDDADVEQVATHVSVESAIEELQNLLEKIS